MLVFKYQLEDGTIIEVLTNQNNEYYYYRVNGMTNLIDYKEFEIVADCILKYKGKILFMEKSLCPK